MTDPTQDRLILGRALRALREQNGLTQKNVAKRAGTSNAYVSHAETGRLDVRWHTLRRLLYAIGVNLRQLADAIDRAESEEANAD
jgi:transcriptional regulator with XRE-family HTH domain